MINISESAFVCQLISFSHRSTICERTLVTEWYRIPITSVCAPRFGGTARDICSLKQNFPAGGAGNQRLEKDICAPSVPRT